MEMLNEIIVRQRYGTEQWEVIHHYGYRESLLAICETKHEATMNADLKSRLMEVYMVRIEG